MRNVLLIVLIFQSSILAAQKNRFNIDLGVNYPINVTKDNVTEESLAREFGLEFGFNYSRVFLDQGIFETGITLDIYEQISWKENKNIGIYIPVQVGYIIGKFELTGGVFYNLVTINSGNGSEQSIYFTLDNNYYDLNSNNTNKDLFGFNVALNYKIGRNYSAYVDIKDFGFLDTNNLNKHYNYFLTTVGLKYYLY